MHRGISRRFKVPFVGWKRFQSPCIGEGMGGWWINSGAHLYVGLGDSCDQVKGAILRAHEKRGFS